METRYLLIIGMILLISGVVLTVCSLFGVIVWSETIPEVRHNVGGQETWNIFSGWLSAEDKVVIRVDYDGGGGASMIWVLDLYIMDSEQRTIGTRHFEGSGYVELFAPGTLVEVSFPIHYDDEYEIYVSYGQTEYFGTVITNGEIQKPPPNVPFLIVGIILVIVGVILIPVSFLKLGRQTMKSSKEA